MTHFLEKVVNWKLTSAAVLAVDPNQPSIDADAIERAAYEHGVFFRLFVGWRPFVFETVSWSFYPTDKAVELAIERIYLRLIEQEVSQAGIEEWVRLVAPQA